MHVLNEGNEGDVIMRVNSINSVNFNFAAAQSNTILQKKHYDNSTTYDLGQLTNLPTKNILAQFSRISFKGEDLSAYDSYRGEKPPAIEIEKYHLSRQVEQLIEEERYAEAISLKLELARICKGQGKERDAFMLERGIESYYSKIPESQRAAVKAEIAEYNQEMADAL